MDIFQSKRARGRLIIHVIPQPTVQIPQVYITPMKLNASTEIKSMAMDAAASVLLKTGTSAQIMSHILSVQVSLWMEYWLRMMCVTHIYSQTIIIVIAIHQYAQWCFQLQSVIGM